MKSLFVVAGAAEMLGGLAFVLAPSLQATLFFGASLSGPAEAVLARVMGLAMMALGLAFWQGRKQPQTPTSRGLAVVVMLYNTAVAALLAATAVGSHLTAVALWPATGLHAALAAWCVWSLRRRV
jgi:hypothetical protein